MAGDGRCFFYHLLPHSEKWVALRPLYYITCGRSAGELALENGQAEVAKFICEYTADVNIRNNLWSTTLDTVEYGVNKGGTDKAKDLLLLQSPREKQNGWHATKLSAQLFQPLIKVLLHTLQLSLDHQNPLSVAKDLVIPSWRCFARRMRDLPMDRLK